MTLETLLRNAISRHPVTLAVLVVVAAMAYVGLRPQVGRWQFVVGKDMVILDTATGQTFWREVNLVTKRNYWKPSAVPRL